MKDFRSDTYFTDNSIQDTLIWLLHHQDSFDSFTFDVDTQQIIVSHAAGVDIVRVGTYLNASYGILLTSK